MPTDEGPNQTLIRTKKGQLPLANTLAVSKKYAGSQKMASRIKRLIKELARGILFCETDDLAKDALSRARATSNTTEQALSVVIADGTLCTSSGTIKLPSCGADPKNADDFRNAEDIMREMRDLERYIKKKPALTSLLYSSLHDKLKISFERTSGDRTGIRTRLRETSEGVSVQINSNRIKHDRDSAYLFYQLS